jgi:ligand-binding SRPBCC domain-containing protein
MMKIYSLTSRQLVPYPLNEVFPFFSKPENLGLLTPENLGFQILTPSPVCMKEGAIIDYAITIASVPVRWTTLITSYEPPYRFIDVQLKGPYAYWRHTHSFSETDDGTLITDEVDYAMPFGLAGKIIHTAMIRRQLKNIFRNRGYAIEKIFPPRDQRGEVQYSTVQRIGVL